MQLNVGERVVPVRWEFTLCSQIPATLGRPYFLSFNFLFAQQLFFELIPQSLLASFL